MTNENEVIPDAPKGGVLNARILWTFAAAYNHTQEDRLLGDSRESVPVLGAIFP